MKSFNEILTELTAIRNRLTELLVSLQTAGEEQEPHDEEALRHGIWSAARELEKLHNEDLPDLDLAKEDPVTRQVLYDCVVQQYFTTRLLEDPGDVFVPAHSPSDCGLNVFFQYGRWFVTWMNLEQDMNRSEAERRELMVFEKNEQGTVFFRAV